METPPPMQMEITIADEARGLIERFLSLKESENGKPKESTESIKLILSKSQARKISEILWDFQDEGSRDVAWASPELEELRAIIDRAIKDHDEN